MALTGDSADNIQELCRGVGPKTALKWIWHSLNPLQVSRKMPKEKLVKVEESRSYAKIYDKLDYLIS
ncbi:MAG: hypothetical protein H0A76_12865 [Candidatus Thiodubiliella endoseptemdiera]|uniref:Uncharacterized protein n=1 Tax=Candidatus Thiodubiliella endoseptemdiera TaxID=2738886 RepID=A0A853F567_9GAMM|nr:hypothetical protein [Candidatus Thiodubiliella endoseptemdiera]